MFIKKRRSSICRDLENYFVPKVTCALIRADMTKKYLPNVMEFFPWLSDGGDCYVKRWDTTLAEMIVEHRVESSGKERRERNS